MQEITLFQFILGILALLIPQIYMLIRDARAIKAGKPLTSSQSESAMGDALEKLGRVYQQALNTISSQDEELKGLRPLILDIAITRQQMLQTQLDKDDWKAHANKLKEQLEEKGLVPRPFKRQSLEGNSDKMKAITAAQIEKYIGSDTTEEK
jgi:hypothetical protein